MTDGAFKSVEDFEIPDGAPAPSVGPVVKPSGKAKTAKAATAVARVAETIAAGTRAVSEPVASVQDQWAHEPPAEKVVVTSPPEVAFPEVAFPEVPEPTSLSRAVSDSGEISSDEVERVATILLPAVGQTERSHQVLAAAAPAQGEAIRQTVEMIAAGGTGALEVQAKILDAIRAQNDAALDLWRSTVTAGSLSGAVRAQTTGVRHIYETAASEWRGVAEVTTRWLSASAKPQSAVTDRSR